MYEDHKTNEEVCRKNRAATEEFDKLLTLMKKRKLSFFFCFFFCKFERIDTIDTENV